MRYDIHTTFLLPFTVLAAKCLVSSTQLCQTVWPALSASCSNAAAAQQAALQSTASQLQ
jgi:hypothetical protein